MLTVYHRTHTPFLTHSSLGAIWILQSIEWPYFSIGEEESMQTLGEHETGALNQNTSESPFKTLKPVKAHFFPQSLALLAKSGL